MRDHFYCNGYNGEENGRGGRLAQNDTDRTYHIRFATYMP